MKANRTIPFLMAVSVFALARCALSQTVENGYFRLTIVEGQPVRVEFDAPGQGEITITEEMLE